MAWSGSSPTKTFSRADGAGQTGANTWTDADAASIDIVAVDHDVHDQDIADGVNTSLQKDGKNQATADIQLGGNQVANVGVATAQGNVPKFTQYQNNVGRFITAANVGGTADVITLTTGFSSTVYLAGQEFTFIVESNNTTTVTVNVDTLGAKAVKRPDGSTNLSADDLAAGSIAKIVYDGTNFLLGGNQVAGIGADVQARIIPVGATMWWGLTTIPAGWVKLTGTTGAHQSLVKLTYPELDALYSADSYPYGSDSTTFDLPPAAERYIRAADADADITGGTGTNTLENANKSHSHTINIIDPGHVHAEVGLTTTSVQSGAGASGVASITAPNTASATTGITATSDTAGGSEARPQTLYQYLILLVSPTAAAAGSLGVHGYQYIHDASTTDSDPGSGKIRYNNATFASITELYIDNVDAYASDISTFIETWDASTSTITGQLTMQKIGAPATYRQFDVTGAVTDETGYRKVLVTPVDDNGSWAANDAMAIEFTRTGDKGTTGTTGATGTGSTVVVRASSTTNGTLSSAFENGDTFDGITLATNDLILLTDQTDASENGIYTVAASGAPSRPTAFNAFGEIVGQLVSVSEGTANADTLWQCTSILGSNVIDTNDNVWAQFTGGGIADVVADTTPQLGGFLDSNNQFISNDQGANIASVAGDTDIWANFDGNTVHITGTNAITDFGTPKVAGDHMWLIFDGAASVVDSATITCVGNANFQAAANDMALVYALSTSTFLFIPFPNDGLPIITTTVAKGGTGATTLTDGGILLGSGTAAITAMGALADGSIVVGDGTTDPVALAAFSSSTGNVLAAKGGTIGEQTFNIPAAAWNAAASNGPEVAVYLDTNVLKFDPSTSESARTTVIFPKGWNEGTITFRAFAIDTAGTATSAETAIFSMAGVAVSDDGALPSVTILTTGSQDSTCTSDGNAVLMVGTTSSALTIDGTPAEGDLVVLEISRDIADTMAGEDAALFNVEVKYTINAGTDA